MNGLVLTHRGLVFGLAASLFCCAAAAQPNQPPKAVASAGVDLNSGQVLNQVILYIGPADSGIAHTVNGAGSSDPDGDPLSYLWTCRESNGNKCFFGLGVPDNQVNFRPNFPAGTWDITLTVGDGQGHSATDSVRVKVLVDLSAPVVTPPDDESISATELGGARGGASSDLHKFLFNSATATDNSTAIFTHLPPQVNGADVDDNTLFPHGTTRVTFRIADSFGNVGTATADVFITDLQSGDLFVGVGEGIPGLGSKGVLHRIRGGSLTEICRSPDYNGHPSFNLDAEFWNRPDSIVVDSKGRMAFVAYLGASAGGFSVPSSWGLLRCDLPGQPAEKLAVFPAVAFNYAGWPVPLPGTTFYNNPSGLHLRRTKMVVIDDNVNNGNPRIVTEEKYVMAFQDSVVPGDSAGHIGNLSLNTETLVFAENDVVPAGIGVSSAHQPILLPSMFYHSKLETVSFLGLTIPNVPVAKTYVAGGDRGSGMLRRIYQPFELQVTANTSLGTVYLGVRAFDGYSDMPDSPIGDDQQIPNASSGCNPFPPTRGDLPHRFGSYSTVTSSGVIYEKNSGLVVNGGFSSPAWTGQLDESLFDLDPQNDGQSYFAWPEAGCKVVPIVNFTPVAGSSGTLPFGNYDFDSQGRGLRPDRMAASPNGLFGTLAAQGRVVQAIGTLDLVDVATGLAAPKGLGAYPPQLGLIALSALIIRIDSPVDVVVTDSLGRRVGVLNGQNVNEFGSQAHDSGAQTHPRVYIIRHPQPGNYSVRSVGTGSGPFTLHVYSVDSEKKIAEHILHAGVAQPGSAGRHDFNLDGGSHVTFSNASPLANAGADQMLTADASGNAVASLNAGGSSDPDGDALSFTWAGPDVFAPGVNPQLTLPVGVHVLTLSADDGKGGTTEDTVTITVVAMADTTAPVLTLPANITVTATSGNGAIVSYSASALDAVDGAVPVTCMPASGTTFAVGATTVNCSASDAAGNSASGSFTVTVNPQPPPPPPPSGGALACSVASVSRVNPGVWAVLVRFTNTSGATFSNLTVSSSSFATLTGSGTVTASFAFSPRPGYLVGTMPDGGATTLRWVVFAPLTVRSFSINATFTANGSSAPLGCSATVNLP